MNLNQFLQKNQLTSAQFAAQLGVSRGAVQKWREGVRIPRPWIMIKITLITEGQVTPTDWYNGVVANGMDKRKR